MKKILILLSILIFTSTIIASEIHDAARAGDLEKVKQLIKADKSILKVPEGEISPLHTAAYDGQTEIAMYMIKKGADVNAKKEGGSTPLHGAAFYGHAETVKMLLKKKADINAVNDARFTPLLSAFANNQNETSKILIEAGADIEVKNNQEATPLMLSCTAGLYEIYNLLIEKGASIDVKEIDNETAMHYAAWGGNVDIIMDLHKRGLEIDAKSNQETTPLHYAANQGRLEAAKYLVENGANVNRAKDNGRTPLIEAALGRHPEMIKYLVEMNADVNKQMISGQTALYFACHDQKEAVEELVKAGANVNLKNRDGRTPMFATIWYENIDAAKILVNNGADVNVQTEDGLTALINAAIESKPKMVEFLLNNGADPNLKENYYGNTALHAASIRGNIEIVDYLLEKGVNASIVNIEGTTAAQFAGKYGHPDVLRALTARRASTDNVVQNFGKSKLLNKKLNKGESNIWYLGHCGFAIQTANHFMVFDYWQRGDAPANPSLANGHINPFEIEGQNIEVFATHGHRDHFDTRILNWAQQIDNVEYIYGFQPESEGRYYEMGYTGENYEYIGPRQVKEIDGMKISTIQANDAGVGFLIEVDGINIYHAGDHAGWRNGERDGYTKEIDYLAELTDKIDFAFLNVTGCHVSDKEALQGAICYTLENLNIDIMFPTHGLDREYVYKEYKDFAAEKGYKIQVICPDNKGDKYTYKGNEIKAYTSIE